MYDYLFKFTLMEYENGKTILREILAPDYRPDPIIGSELSSRTISFEGKVCKFQIWYYSYGEFWQRLRHDFCRVSHGVILSFRTDDLRSFKKILEYAEDIKNYAPKDIFIMVVGTYSHHEREVSISDAQALANKMGAIEYVEWLPGDVINVEEAFISLARALYEKEKLKPSQVQINSKESHPKKSILIIEQDAQLLEKLNKARSHYSNKNYEQAIKFCRKALSILPSNIEALLIKARSERQLERFQEAQESYELIFSFNREHQIASQEIAELLEQRDAKIRAEELLKREKIQRREKEKEDAQAKERAKREAENKEKLAKQNSLLSQAEQHIHDEDYFLCIEKSDAVLKNSPNHIQALLLKGQSQKALHLYDEALGTYQLIIGLEPSHELAKNAISSLLAMKDKLQQKVLIVNRVTEKVITAAVNGLPASEGFEALTGVSPGNQMSKNAQSLVKTMMIHYLESDPYISTAITPEEEAQLVRCLCYGLKKYLREANKNFGFGKEVVIAARDEYHQRTLLSEVFQQGISAYHSNKEFSLLSLTQGQENLEDDITSEVLKLAPFEELPDNASEAASIALSFHSSQFHSDKPELIAKHLLECIQKYNPSVANNIKVNNSVSLILDEEDGALENKALVKTLQRLYEPEALNIKTSKIQILWSSLADKQVRHYRKYYLEIYCDLLKSDTQVKMSKSSLNTAETNELLQHVESEVAGMLETNAMLENHEETAMRLIQEKMGLERQLSHTQDPISLRTLQKQTRLSRLGACSNRKILPLRKSISRPSFLVQAQNLCHESP